MNNEELLVQLEVAKEFKAIQIAKAEHDIEEAKNRLNTWVKMIPFEVLEFIKENAKYEATDTINRFNKHSIDLVMTYRNISKKYGHKAVSHQRFGIPIIRMAEAVITTYFDWECVKGVRACIEHEVKAIRWRNTIWLLPLNEIRLFGFTPYSELDRQHIALLTDSIILSIVAYRIQLNEHHTNLSMIVFNDMVLGLEYLCYWISQGVTIDPAQIDVIEVLDVNKTIGWIRK